MGQANVFTKTLCQPSFAARNFRILHPIIKDGEVDRFGSLLLCQEWVM
jgi:hypothetical protein